MSTRTIERAMRGFPVSLMTLTEMARALKVTPESLIATNERLALRTPSAEAEDASKSCVDDALGLVREGGLELVIDRAFKSYSVAAQQQFLRAIESLMAMDIDVRIVHQPKG